MWPEASCLRVYSLQATNSAVGLMALGFRGVEVRVVHVYGLRRFSWTGFSFWLSVLVFQDVGLDGLRSSGGGVCSDGVAAMFSIMIFYVLVISLRCRQWFHVIVESPPALAPHNLDGQNMRMIKDSLLHFRVEVGLYGNSGHTAVPGWQIFWKSSLVASRCRVRGPTTVTLITVLESSFPVITNHYIFNFAAPARVYPFVSRVGLPKVWPVCNKSVRRKTVLLPPGRSAFLRVEVYPQTVFGGHWLRFLPSKNRSAS